MADSSIARMVLPTLREHRLAQYSARIGLSSTRSRRAHGRPLRVPDEEAPSLRIELDAPAGRYELRRDADGRRIDVQLGGDRVDDEPIMRGVVTERGAPW